jgi:hypothetical protein
MDEKLINSLVKLYKETPGMNEDMLFTMAVDKGAAEPEAVVQKVLDRINNPEATNDNALGVAHEPNGEKNTLAASIASWKY